MRRPPRTLPALHRRATLQVFYVQAETQYDGLRERLHQLPLHPAIVVCARDILFVTREQHADALRVRLAWLESDIVEAILGGCQLANLTAAWLMRDTRIPSGWQDQRRALGFV